uniref:Uncharacterized protein n=1 Tax=Caenorhabditis japonica TaxID=281687 RepID=A0A8R1HQC2_CAEJA
MAFVAILAVVRVLIYSKAVVIWKISRAVNIAIIAIIISLLPPTAYFVTSGAFFFISPGWFFDNRVAYARIFNSCAFATFMILLGISYASYITLVVLIIATKRHATSVNSRKEEISILLPYTIVLLYISVGLIYWYAVTDKIDFSNNTPRGMSTIMWITGGYWTPTFLLVFHRLVSSFARALRSRRVQRCFLSASLLVAHTCSTEHIWAKALASNAATSKKRIK